MNTIAELNDPFEYEFGFEKLIERANDFSELITNIEIELLKLTTEAKRPYEKIINNIKKYKIVLDQSKDLFNKDFSNLKDKKLKKFLNLSKIKSFTPINNNIKMWSFYSLSHTGYCVEFNFTNDKILNNLYKVRYEENRKNFYEIFNLNGNIYEDIQIKSVEWQFENEMRLFMLNHDERYLDLDKTCIKSIYLGAKIESKNKELILDYTSHLGIPVYQMHLNQNEFKLNYDLIERGLSAVRHFINNDSKV